MPSATGGLDERLQSRIRATAAKRVECNCHALTQRFCAPGSQQQRARVQRDDALVRFAAASREERSEAIGILIRRPARDLLERHAPEAGLLGRDLDLIEL